MSSLYKIQPANSYQQVLNVGSNNSGLTASLQNVTDGKGTTCPLQLSTSTLNVQGTFQINGTTAVGITPVAAHTLLANITGSTALPVAVATNKFIQSINVQSFLTAGAATYTPTTGMVFCVIEVLAGGGAGGGTGNTSTHAVAAVGGGGGSGGYVKCLLTAAQVGTTGTISVGAAGTGVSANTGGTGGNTTITFNSGVNEILANGGVGGFSASLLTTSTINLGGALGGAVSATTYGTVMVNQAGNSGGSPDTIAQSQGTALGLAGANSQYGAGGAAQATTSATASGFAGIAALGNGAGGSGSTSTNSAGSLAGGNGTAGCIIITEFVAV